MDSIWKAYLTWQEHSVKSTVQTITHNSSINWPFWPSSWVLVNELSGFGFESRGNQLNFRYCTCFVERVPWHSGKYRVWFTLKCVRDMARTFSQMHHTDNYSQHSSINWLSWPNGWVLVYELIDCGFESLSCHLNFRYRVYFENIQSNIEGGFTLKFVYEMTRTYIQMHETDKYSQHSTIIRTCFEQGFPWHSGKYRVDSLWNAYMTWQEHSVKCIIQIITHNTAQSFGYFGQRGEYWPTN